MVRSGRFYGLSTAAYAGVGETTAGLEIQGNLPLIDHRIRQNPVNSVFCLPEMLTNRGVIDDACLVSSTDSREEHRLWRRASFQAVLNATSPAEWVQGVQLAGLQAIPGVPENKPTT